MKNKKFTFIIFSVLLPMFSSGWVLAAERHKSLDVFNDTVQKFTPTISSTYIASNDNEKSVEAKTFGKVLNINYELKSTVEDNFWYGGDKAYKSENKAANPPAGLSGSWYNPNQSGHGVMLDILPDNRMWLAWFTYDFEGNPIFLTANGIWDASTNSAYFDMIYTSGMTFGEFNSNDIEQELWGGLMFEFNNCESATIYFASPYIDDYTGWPYGSGSFPVSRLTTIKDLTCSLNGGGGGQGNKETYLRVQNKLLNDVTLSINGNVIGVSSAGQTQGSTVTYSGNKLTVNWRLNRTRIGGNGSEIGDYIEGNFVVNNPGSITDLVVNNRFSDGSGFFVPVISNSTGSSLLVGVNMGLQSENRCNCTVGPYKQNVSVGYYKLFSNSNVRVYTNGSYSGSYTYWNNLVPYVQSDSGRLNLSY